MIRLQLKLSYWRYLLMFVLAVCLSAPLWSDDLTANKAQQQRLEAELTKLQQKLTKNNRETSAQRQALKAIETELGEIYRSIDALEAKVAQQQQHILSLQIRQQDLEAKLAAQADTIKTILRLAYKQKNQPLIKLLLSGSRPEEVSRHLYYFSLLTANQNATLNRWLTDQAELSDTLSRYQGAVVELTQQQTKLQADRKALETQKRKREQVVATLSAENQSVSATIAAKKEERERLQALIEQMQAELERMALEFPEVTAISDSKGQLSWPVSGRLQNQYGRRIEGSALRWQGLVIAAPEGTPVKAVHRGRVVFADFFKSNGLLVIIDHGQGIWSLYGRNRSLLTEVGAWVETGDVIAEVGQSGGYSESGLYFEVRDNGKPLNPAAWLSKR